MGEGFTGALYRLDPDGRVHTLETGIGISNGLCWSPDGRTMYFADSPRHTIHVYDFDPDSGLPSRRREFARTGPGAEPDGSTVDAEGAVWNAQWGGGRVVRYSPTGEVLETVDTPGAMQPSCVAFGGDALELLCVTSAWIGLDAAARAAQPQAGHVFLYETSARGLPENRARLAPAVLAA